MFFEVGKETADHIGSELLDGEAGRVGKVALNHEAKEQPYGIAVALLGVDAKVSVRDELFEKKAAG